MSGGRRRGGKPAPFISIPRHVMRSESYKGLGGSAVKLLNALLYQYRGNNNGDLSTGWALMKQHGFKSQETLTRAKNELLQADLIMVTREGRFMNPNGQATLYAVTWAPIDDCRGKSLEVDPTVTPPRKFTLEHLA